MSTSITPGSRTRGDAADTPSSQSRSRASLTPVSLFAVLLVFWIMTQIQFVLVLGLFSLLLGTILESPLHRLQSRHIPRPAAIFLIYVGIIGGLVLLGFIITPLIGDQADVFRVEFPNRVRDLQAEWQVSANPLLNGVGYDLLDRVLGYFDDTTPELSGSDAARVLPFLTSLTTGIVGILTVLVVTFYYLMEKALIRRVIIQQIKFENQARANRIWDSVEGKVGGWIRGQLLLCLIIGVIATTSYGIIGLSFWPLLGLWAGITEIIPIVGPWIGGIPAVIVALTMGWQTTLITIAIIVGMQTIENWFLVPRVMRGAVGLTPLTVFTAILAGTQFMGPIGAVLAIPIAASLQVVITEWLDSRRVRDESSQVSGWRWMLTRATNRDDDAATGESASVTTVTRPARSPAEPVGQADDESTPQPDGAPGRDELLTPPEIEPSAQWRRPSRANAERSSPDQPPRRTWGALRVDSPTTEPRNTADEE